jgi:hypothetical protein
MFWPWLLKYSPLFITGAVSAFLAWLLQRLTARHSELVYYTSQPTWVRLPPPPGQQVIEPIGTFTLFLLNQGKAPAREVHVGHYWLPANNVFPDIPREVVDTPGGGRAIRFAVLPPKTLVGISYLFFGLHTVQNILSYVGSEEGAGKAIPVVLQRVWPPWILRILQVLLLAGLWVAVNATWSLIKLLWIVYYNK